MVKLAVRSRKEMFTIWEITRQFPEL